MWGESLSQRGTGTSQTCPVISLISHFWSRGTRHIIMGRMRADFLRFPPGKRDHAHGQELWLERRINPTGVLLISEKNRKNDEKKTSIRSYKFLT